MSRIVLTFMASTVPLKLFPGSLFLCLFWQCFFCILSTRKWSATRIGFKCDLVCSHHQWDGYVVGPSASASLYLMIWWYCHLLQFPEHGYYGEPATAHHKSSVTLGCAEQILLLCIKQPVHILAHDCIVYILPICSSTKVLHHLPQLLSF
jgi:hypothetical protein